MKPFFYLTLGSFALLVWAGAGCRTNSEAERPLVSTVIGIGGAARYNNGQSTNWYELKEGAQLPPGSAIQTAVGSLNGVCVAIGEHVPQVGANRAGLYRADKITIGENSILKLEKVTAKTIAGKNVRDTRMVLLTGTVFGNAGMVWPTDVDVLAHPFAGPKVEMLKPQPDKSYYEIRSSNTVLHVEHALFRFTVSEKILVFEGAAALEFKDKGVTKDLFGPQLYDLETGKISQIDLNYHRHYWNGGVWDWMQPPMKAAPAATPLRPF
jgi:hypothetical protein